MMRCPDCLDAMINRAQGAPFNGLPCCLGRSLADTPTVRQKAAAEAIERTHWKDWAEIRAEAVRIIEERKARKAT
jgi:hypothetical protein